MCAYLLDKGLLAINGNEISGTLPLEIANWAGSLGKSDWCDL